MTLEHCIAFAVLAAVIAVWARPLLDRWDEQELEDLLDDEGR
jgi:hypothetical protein